MKKTTFTKEPEDKEAFTKTMDQTYSRFARAYDLSVKFFMPFWRRWLKKAIPFIEGEKVLEVSFGTGYLLTQYAHQFQTFGIDYNKDLVEIAKKNLNEKSIQANLQQGNVEALPLIEFPTSFLGQDNLPSFTYLQPFTNGVGNLEAAASKPESGVGFEWYALLRLLYYLGMIVVAGRFLLGLHKILSLLKSGTKEKKKHFTVVRTRQEHLPFSFFSYLFLSEKVKIEEPFSEMVFKHEHAHINGMHSIDVLLMELFCILFWFNPFIHLYRTSLRNTHEYLADQVVLESTRAKNYGHFLINQSQSRLQIVLANHFFQSQLKNRITMITKLPSSKTTIWRYIFTIPILLLLTLTLASQEIIEKMTVEVKQPNGTTTQYLVKDMTKIDKLLNPNEIESMDVLKKENKIIVTLKENQQERVVSGTVVNEAGKPMPGVSVIAKGTTTGTITDASGSYMLKIPDNVEGLVFAYKGYAKVAMELGDSETVNVVLKAQKISPTEKASKVKQNEPVQIRLRDEQDPTKPIKLEIRKADGTVVEEKIIQGNTSDLDKMFNPDQIESISVLKGEEKMDKIIITMKGAEAGIMIKGKVFDEKTSVGLSGVSVLIKDSTTGTITDASGNYMIKIPEGDQTLVFVQEGFVKQQIKVGDSTEIYVVMKPTK